jgi:predicted transport protein
MPIFRIKGKKAEKIKPTKFSGANKEKQLQTLIENNLDMIFEMTFIDTEVPTTHGGQMDTLAIDRNNRPVIIEYKADKSSTVLLQGLFYMDWLVENEAEFEKLVKVKLRKEIVINWKSGIRLILIAKSFAIWDKFAVNRIKEEVELYEYTLYENNELKLDKTTLPKDFKGAIRTPITSLSEYSIEDHMKRIRNESIKKTVKELRERIKAISEDIVERATKDYIIFKSTVNFAAIYTQTKQFWFDVKLPKDQVKKQFKQLDVRPHKDEVFTHIRYNKNTDIEDLISLAEQAYENTL